VPYIYHHLIGEAIQPYSAASNPQNQQAAVQ